MDINEAIEILNNWIITDREMRDFKTDTDYDRFCERRNVAIEIVLAEIRRQNERG